MKQQLLALPDVEVREQFLLFGPVAATDVIASAFVRHKFSVGLDHDRVEVFHSADLKVVIREYT